MVPSTRDPDRLLVLRMRRARHKAREAALAEVLALLRGLGARAAPGGPMAELPGVSWISLPESSLDQARSRLCGLGYTASIDLVALPEDADSGGKSPAVRWKGRKVALLRVYGESEETLRAEAPDRRTFLLECGDGIVRPIAGYRGGTGPLEHRALPAIDARLLVNLVATQMPARLLDPFAGAGGVIIQARARGFGTVSLDRDLALRFGLEELSDAHVVGDASRLPFAAGSFDAIAGEPPYHHGARDTIAASIAEMARVIRGGGRIAMLAASAQADALRHAGERAGLKLELDTAIDRKGTDVSCLCWVR